MRYLPPLPRKYKGVILAGLIVWVMCAVSAVIGSRGVVHLRRLHRQQAAAEAIAFDLAQKNRQLREHLRRLEDDDDYLEKLARERLGWIKPGEIVYHVGRSWAPERERDREVPAEGGGR